MGLRAHLRYARILLRHKVFVFVAGRRFDVPLWRLLIHDWTKVLPVEWAPYVRRFASGRSGVLDKSADPDDFQRAWTHHWHRNPHHWEHWLVFDGQGRYRPLPMPETYVREMLADWHGAGRAYSGGWDISDWFAENRDRIVLHPETRARVLDLLGAD